MTRMMMMIVTRGRGMTPEWKRLNMTWNKM
jgi:hypothetical protein